MNGAAQRLVAGAGPLVVAAAIAALWPLSAYRADPFVLPLLIGAALVALTITRRPEFGVAVALALAPFTNLRVGGGQASEISLGKPLQVVLPALAFCTLAYALLTVRRQRSASVGWLPIAVILFLAATIVSAISALDPSASVNKLGILATSAALFFAVLHICQSREQLFVVIGGALAGVVLASLQGLLQEAFGHTEFGFVAEGTVVGRIQGSFGHPNIYGGFLAFLIPLAAAVAFVRAFPGSLRLLAALALVLGMPAIVLSYARGAIAALVLGALVWLAAVRPRLALLVAAIVAVAAVTLAPAALKERFDPEATSTHVPIRADIWQAALDIYAAHPFTGVGLDNFSEAYSRLPATVDQSTQRRLLHQEQLLVPPHAQNLYLNVLAETGVVGFAAFALFAALAVATTYRGTRLSDPAGRTVAIAAGIGLMTMTFHSFLEVTLLSEPALPLFALLAVTVAFVRLEAVVEEREPELADEEVAVA